MDLIYRFDPFEPILPRRIDGPDEAIKALLEGNALFARIVDRVRSEFQGNHDPAPFLVPWDPMFSSNRATTCSSSESQGTCWGSSVSVVSTTP
jgi:hypothetical protein